MDFVICRVLSGFAAVAGVSGAKEPNRRAPPPDEARWSRKGRAVISWPDARGFRFDVAGHAGRATVDRPARSTWRRTVCTRRGRDPFTRSGRRRHAKPGPDPPASPRSTALRQVLSPVHPARRRRLGPVPARRHLRRQRPNRRKSVTAPRWQASRRGPVRFRARCGRRPHRRRRRAHRSEPDRPRSRRRRRRWRGRRRRAADRRVR